MEQSNVSGFAGVEFGGSDRKSISCSIVVSHVLLLIIEHNSLLQPTSARRALGIAAQYGDTFPPANA